MNNASDFIPAEGISPLGAGISLVALLTVDLTGSIVLIFLLYLHLRKAKERELNPRTTFQLLLYFAIMEFAYSTIVEGISVVCYLTSFNLTMSRGLCSFQAWASLTFTVSANWTITLLAVERFLSGTKPVSLQGQRRRRDRLLYTCYTGVIISALAAVVPVTREGSIRTFDRSNSFCHFDYSVIDDPLMMSFYICIIAVTLIFFQVQFFSFVNLLCEERQTEKAVNDATKLDYEEQNTSTNQNIAIYQEYWLYRNKNRKTFAGKHEWNLTVTILSLVAWLWLCILPFLVVLVKSQSGGEVSSRISFAAVRMLSIHNAVNPFLSIFIFAPFRQRVLHYITCGRIDYSRDDFILSKYTENDVTRNNEPNWWRVTGSNQCDESTPTVRYKEGPYVYENDVTDEVDSYYNSEYDSNGSRDQEDFRSGQSVQPISPSSVYYLNEEGEADVRNDYLLSVPVNRPGAGSGEIVERIFILHQSSKNGNHGNDGLDKSSLELIGEDVSNSPKLRQVVQNPKFKNMLKRNRCGLEDISPRLYKVVASDSPTLQNDATKENSHGKDIYDSKQTTAFVESVQMTPKLRRIVESPAFRKSAIHSDSFVIDSESNSSTPEHVVKRTDPTFIQRTKQTNNVIITPQKRVVESQNFRKFILQQQQKTESPKLSKVSKKSHVITVVESRSRQNGAVARVKSKKSELIELSDESTKSGDRQINTPDRMRNRDNNSQDKNLEKFRRKNGGTEYRHSLPNETALLQDVGSKPLQVLGLSPKYNKNKPEENGLFSKADDRPEILNALFQKALLIGSSTAIIDKDVLKETTGSNGRRLRSRLVNKPRAIQKVRNNSDPWISDFVGKEILIDEKFSEISSDSVAGKKSKVNDDQNSTKNGKVNFKLDRNERAKSDNMGNGVVMETLERTSVNIPTIIERNQLYMADGDKIPLEVGEEITLEKKETSFTDQYSREEVSIDIGNKVNSNYVDPIGQERGNTTDKDIENSSLPKPNHENDKKSTSPTNFNNKNKELKLEDFSSENNSSSDQKIVLQNKREDGDNGCETDGVRGGRYEEEEAEKRKDNRNKRINDSGSRVIIPKIIVNSDDGSKGFLYDNSVGEELTRKHEKQCS